MLQQEKPADYVLATGRAETIRNFASGAAAAFGFDLEWTGDSDQSRGIDKRSGRTIIAVDPAFYRPLRLTSWWKLSKAKAVLGWEAKTTLEELIEMMVKADYDRAKSGVVLF